MQRPLKHSFLKFSLLAFAILPTLLTSCMRGGVTTRHR